MQIEIQFVLRVLQFTMLRDLIYTLLLIPYNSQKVIRDWLCSHYAIRDVTPQFSLLLRKAPLLAKSVVGTVHKAGCEPGLAPCKWFGADDPFVHPFDHPCIGYFTFRK